MQTECGHLFCRGCLEPVLATPHPVCPIDKSDISANCVSDFTSSHILQIKYLCFVHRFFLTMHVRERFSHQKYIVISAQLGAPGLEL